MTPISNFQVPKWDSRGIREIDFEMFKFKFQFFKNLILEKHKIGKHNISKPWFWHRISIPNSFFFKNSKSNFLIAFESRFETSKFEISVIDLPVIFVFTRKLKFFLNTIRPWHLFDRLSCKLDSRTQNCCWPLALQRRFVLFFWGPPFFPKCWCFFVQNRQNQYNFDDFFD